MDSKRWGKERKKWQTHMEINLYANKEELTILTIPLLL